MTYRSFTFASIFLFSLLLPSCGLFDGPRDFTISFTESDGLQIGNKVLYKGITIGEVTSIAIVNDSVRVGVSVEAEYKDQIYREAKFVIDSDAGLFDSDGERRIEIEDRGDMRTPIQEGEIVIGYSGLWDELLGQAESASKDVGSWLKSTNKDLLDALGDYSESPEARRLVEDIEEYWKKGEELAEEEYNKFKDDTLPDLTKRAERLRERMEEEGHPDEAKKFWKEFNESLREADRR